MADWFKLHENWFTEPRLQWAIGQENAVVTVWLWVLTECCRTKSDTVGLHSEDYEMIGIQKMLNVTPGIFCLSLGMLEKIKYIEVDKELKTIKVLKWNEFQSDYLIKKSRRESDIVRHSPTKSDNVRLEERRGDKKREEQTPAIALNPPSYGFSAFWELYPKTVAKLTCQKVWKEFKFDKATADKVLDALRLQIASKEWKQEGGKFIPNPEKWLKGGCWEDKVNSNSPSVFMASSRERSGL